MVAGVPDTLTWAEWPGVAVGSAIAETTLLVVGSAGLLVTGSAGWLVAGSAGSLVTAFEPATTLNGLEY